MAHAPLTLRLELRAGLPCPAGTVAVVNEGSEEVRIWRRGNEWGDAAFSFEVLKAGEVFPVVLGPQVYTRNVPSSVAVGAGESHEWPFVLAEEEWDSGPLLARLLVPGAQLVAVYDAAAVPAPPGAEVWTGTLRSAPVPV